MYGGFDGHVTQEHFLKYLTFWPYFDSAIDQYFFEDNATVTWFEATKFWK